MRRTNLFKPIYDPSYVWSWYFSLWRHRNLLRAFYFSRFILLAPKITRISSAALTANDYPIAPIYFSNINNPRLTSSTKKKKYLRWDRREMLKLLFSDYWQEFDICIMASALDQAQINGLKSIGAPHVRTRGIILRDPVFIFFIERNMMYVFVPYCIY